jgi:hypothetical protein
MAKKNHKGIPFSFSSTPILHYSQFTSQIKLHEPTDFFDRIEKCFGSLFASHGHVKEDSFFLFVNSQELSLVVNRTDHLLGHP